MPVLAVYQQTFQASQLATYRWEFVLNRILRTKQGSRFVVKVNNTVVGTTSIVPAVANNQLLLYMTSPELCIGTNTQIKTPTATVITNKIPLNQISQSFAVFVCNDFPTNPIVFNAEYTSTQLAPTSGNFIFTTLFTIYEFDGDIPDSVIF